MRRVAQIEVPKSASERAQLYPATRYGRDGYVRGGLDDALDRLARRDELRRRAAGEATGTPPAVTELVEAIAAVVAHNPQLGVTVGVEGAGEPLLLHFYFGDGQVQVNADTAVAAQPDEPESVAPRHADFDVEAEAEEAYPPSQDDQDRFGYASAATDDRHDDESSVRSGGAVGWDSSVRSGAGWESDTAERRYGSFDAPPDPRYADMRPGESSRDLGARMRDLGLASTHSEAEYPPHPFAPTPRPEVPPQTRQTQPPYAQPTPTQPTSAQPMSAQPTSAQPAHAMPPQPRPAAPQRPEHTHAEFAQPDYAEPTVRLPREQPRPPAGHTTQRIPHQAQPREQRAGMPTPLPKPIPLKVERPEETEMAARRLAALLRDDPSLLNQPPD